MLLQQDLPGSENKPLHSSVREGDVSKCMELINGGADVNELENGATPLCVAAGQHGGHIEICVTLISYGGANVNTENDVGATPLHLAAKYGHIEICSALLDSGANIESRAENGVTPLHVAAKHGHAEVCELLTQRGADVGALTDHNAVTPLHMAVRGGHVEASVLLIQRGADVMAKDDGKSTPLFTAVELGLTGVCEMMITYGCGGEEITYGCGGEEINARHEKLGITPLCMSVRHGHIAVCELLLLLGGADVNFKMEETGLTPLHYVGTSVGWETRRMQQRRPEVCALLLRHGAKVRATTLNKADQRPPRGLQPRPGGHTSLHVAVYHGHVGVVELLLQHGAEVNARNEEGKTALSVALQPQHEADRKSREPAREALVRCGGTL